MKLFLARKDKKLHSLIWVASSYEAEELDNPLVSPLIDSEFFVKFNGFLSAKDSYEFISLIEELGRPMLHQEIDFDSSFDSDTKNVKRRYSVLEFKSTKIRKRFTIGSRRMLAHESWFYAPYVSIDVKENAARKVVAKYDPNDALDVALNEVGDNGVVVVEPLQDWLALKNYLVLLLTLKAKLSSVQSETKSNKPLDELGFEFREVTQFGIVDAANTTYSAFVIPIVFNEYWRNETFAGFMGEVVSLLNPFTEAGFLQWAQYSKIGCESHREGINNSYVRFKLSANDLDNNHEIKYISFNQLRGKPGSLSSYKEDWGGNLYLGITGFSYDEQEKAALFLFDKFAGNRFKYGSYSCDFGLAREEGGIMASSLADQMWLTLLGREGVRVGICEHCGMPFLATISNTRKRYCSVACSRSTK